MMAETVCMIREGNSGNTHIRTTAIESDSEEESTEGNESDPDVSVDDDDEEAEDKSDTSSYKSTDTHEEDMKEIENEVCTMGSDDNKNSTSTGSDTDGSVNARCLFISSAANIRRRELHGQGRYYQEEESVEVKKKRS